MKKIKLTCAHAIVKHLISQKILINGKKEQLFAGVFGIFGHGNVACLGQALQENQKELPTWRGHHEQNMALTGIAYARAKRRKQIFVATSSVGPGSTNMVTAAAVAMSNRLPLLLLPGDTFASRMPDPVLQQVEHFNNPGITQNDAFKPVTRYFDRITRPEQILQSLPQAIQIMLDPADCGPACLSLSQDIQGEVFEYPEEFFKEKVHTIRRPRADDFQIKQAAEKIKKTKCPIIISGGGVFYSDAMDELGNFAIKHNIPVILLSVQTTPRRRYEPIHTPYKVPAMLHEAGVRFCISTDPGYPFDGHVRTLPNEAMRAAAWGLPKSEAIRAITLSAAEILGIDERVGSLEPGKDATFFIADAHPLIQTTNPMKAYIQGREVDLTDRQKNLWEKYKEKYRRLGRLNE